LIRANINNLINEAEDPEKKILNHHRLTLSHLTHPRKTYFFLEA